MALGCRMSLDSSIGIGCCRVPTLLCLEPRLAGYLQTQSKGRQVGWLELDNPSSPCCCCRVIAIAADTSHRWW